MASLDELRIATDNLSLFDLPNEVCDLLFSHYVHSQHEGFDPCSGSFSYAIAASDQICLPSIPKYYHSHHPWPAVARSITH